MRVELIPFGPPEKGWEIEVCFEVIKGCYATRLDILYIRIHSPDGEIMDITEVWEELYPTLQSKLKTLLNL
jgi:hypothetical protein